VYIAHPEQLHLINPCLIAALTSVATKADRALLFLGGMPEQVLDACGWPALTNVPSRLIGSSPVRIFEGVLESEFSQLQHFLWRKVIGAGGRHVVGVVLCESFTHDWESNLLNL
jgi:hypothetical protein